MEIEVKYTVKELPEQLEKYNCIRMEQGYLCGYPTVRIRKADDSYILTYKSKLGMGEVDEQAYRMNQEVEMPLDEKGYQHLKNKIDGYMVEKERYIIPYGAYIIELDVFKGKLNGLVVAEVEFEDEEQAKSFEPPSWFGKNVSGDHRYSNTYLSQLENIDVFF